MPARKKNVSIGIININNRDLLRDCLRTIYQYPPSCPYEIIVLDMDSWDGSADMVRGEFPAVKLIVSREKNGFGRNHNIIFREAAMAYYLPLNNDVRIMPGFFDELFRPFDEDPLVGATGPLTYYSENGEIIFEKKHPISLGTYVYYTFLINRVVRSIDWIRRRTFPFAPCKTWITVERISGVAMLIPSDVYRELGGFDEDFFLTFEDDDLCLRLRRRGLKVVFNPRSHLVHLVSRSTNSGSQVYFRKLSALLYMKKNKPFWYFQLFRWVMFATTFIKLVGRRAVGALTGKNAPEKTKAYKDILKIAFTGNGYIYPYRGKPPAARR